ncbi:hypothetical protein LPJ81_001359 [Coemansia sp. IMI 209127]|nr:hypothetical protein LPJ81_001359 [Coemansia sp. IMI 209127]
MTVITTTEPAADCQGKWIVRRHRLLRLVENGYVNASSLLLSGGVASEQERSIVLSLEVGRFKWRRPQSKLYGTWIPLPRARALAATCSLNHRLGPFLNDNLESYFPAPLPTSFIRHLIMPFFSDSASMLLSPSQPELDATSAAFSSDASALLAKETPTSEAAAVAAAATGKESGVSAESSEVATAIAATELSESAQTDDIMPVVSSHPVVTSTALSSTEAKASATSTASAANALFGSELGIGIQNMANSAMASYAQSLLRQPKQSISRSSTFGATARGTPSPSIIQSLATRGGGGALNFAGAAKAIFGSDDRQLQSFLQLLSAESPMLSTSIASEFQADSHSPRSSRAGSPAASSAEAATTSITAVAPEAQDAGDPSLLPSPFGTKPEVKAMINDLAKSTLADGGYLASLVKEALTNKTGRQAERADASNATAEDSRIATPVSPGDASTVSGTRSSGDVGGSDDPKLATGLLSTDAKAESGIVGYVTDQKDADALAETEVTSLDTTRFGDSMDVDSAEQSDDDLDLRMVFSADDDDMDMICRSTPPSPPPPPPHTLPRLRKLSSTPLLLSRPESPALSESLSSAGDHTLLNDQGHEHLTKQQQHGIGSFNARLAQSMEAFGFTGTAKTSLLLRLRAAAAAKSTGRQQAVAPYMLYRSSAGAGGVGIAAAAAAGAGGASSGGAGSGGYKRSRLGLNDVDINGVLAGGVRKRARVIRVSRAKPGSKQAAGNGAGTSSSSSQLANKGANGVRGRNKGTPAVPDASVVLRLASAIYNHTLNLTALAHSQRQAAAAAAAEAAHNAGGDGSTSSTQSATPAGSSAEGKRSSTGGPSTSGGGSGGIRNKQQLLHGSVPKAQMGMRSPENGRLPATMVGRPPQRPSPSRPSPQQQKASSIAGNRAVPPRPPALTQQQQQQQQQRPAMQRPLGGGSPRPTMQPPRGHQSPVRPPLNGNRPPANNAVQRMPPQGLQRQSPRPSSSGVGVGVPSQQQQQQRPMVRRPPLPQQPRPRPGAPIRGPAQRPPGQQQQQPSVGRPTGAATPPTLQRPPLLRSGATGSPKQTNNAQQQQQQQLDTPAVTSAAAAATTPAVSINSAKTHKPQKAS